MARRGAWIVAFAVLLAVAAITTRYWEARMDLQHRVHALTGGTAQAGLTAIERRPCGGCHQIPGVPGARGKIGPSLKGFADRVYIGGHVTNSPDNLVAWIENPHTIDPNNVMPPMGIGDREARDIAAYLYTLN